MSHHTAIRTTVATLGASGLLAMALAAPAMAYRPDPGTGSLQERPDAGSSNSMEYRGGSLGPAASGQGSSNSAVHLKKRRTAPQAPAPVVQVRHVEDKSFEFVQLGAGFLVGATFVGAGALATSRYRHSRVAQPASG